MHGKKLKQWGDYKTGIITYKNAKNGLVRHSIVRVFYEDVNSENAFAESRNTTPILNLDP